MTTERAIEVLQSHKSHWKRLLREKICDKTEGTDFINAIDMAIKGLQALCTNGCEYCEYTECPLVQEESEEEENGSSECEYRSEEELHHEQACRLYQEPS